MLRIAIVEYQNYINENGQPKGHGKKALDELNQLLILGDYKIKCIASKEYYHDDETDGFQLKSIVRTNEKRVFRALRLWRNYRKAIELASDCDFIWFTNTDWMLLIWIALGRKNNRIILTVFRDLYKDAKQKNWGPLENLIDKLLLRCVDKVDLAVITNPKKNYEYFRRTIKIPDYYFDEKKYKKYQTCSKQNRIVCVGLIIRDKDIKGVLRHFGDSGIPILVAGDFEDSQYYESVSNLVTENIKVENRRIPDDEFLEIIGTSKYVIMPYSKYMYFGATSGVLLETIFCGSIPIAPNFLLDNNNVYGIGYDNLDDLPKDISGLEKLADSISNDTSGFNMKTIFERIDMTIKSIATVEN